MRGTERRVRRLELRHLPPPPPSEHAWLYELTIGELLLLEAKALATGKVPVDDPLCLAVAAAALARQAGEAVPSLVPEPGWPGACQAPPLLLPLPPR